MAGRKSEKEREDWVVADDGGQSEILTVILLIGIAVLSIATILVIGSTALDTGKQSVEVGQAELDLMNLDQAVSGVALDQGGGSRQMELGVKGRYGQMTTGDTSWLRVEMINATTGRTDIVVTNQTLGTVRYVQDGISVGYEGGGVFRGDRGGSVLVSRPEFHYRDGTLTLPIISINGEPRLSSDVYITRNGPSQRMFPDDSANLTNLVNDTKVTVTVHSEFYEAWGQYFEDSTDAFVSYDHAAETATVKFLALPNRTNIRNGIIATAGNGRLEMHGTGAYTDSYNSSSGNYTATKSKNGTIEAVGDVYMGGNSTVHGNVRGGSTVEFDGGPHVLGDIYWTDPPKPDAGKVSDEDGITQIEGVATVEPIDGYVYQHVADIRDSNNNSDADLISDERLVMGKKESGTLQNGRYYLERLELNGGELTLDTTGGGIDLAVRDCLLVNNKSSKQAKLTIVGSGTARVYAASENKCEVTAQGKRDVNLHVGKKAKVQIKDENSSKLRIYGPRDFRGAIMGSKSSHISFDGVVYAPAGEHGDGYFFIKQADLYGAAVAGEVTVGQYGAIHFDKGLHGVSFPRSPTASRLAFMHVGVHRVNITSG